MTRHALVFALVTLIATSASADHFRGLRPSDTAGAWTGVASGTFQGQPYAATSVLLIARDGRTAIQTDDGTLGPARSECQLVSFTPAGVGKAHCVVTSGAAAGLELDVNYVLTDSEQKLVSSISMPGLFLTATFYRP